VSCHTKRYPSHPDRGVGEWADDHILVPKNTENPETMSATKNSVYLVNKKLYKSARQETVEEHKAAKA
jgi:hypothetical protein